MDLYTYAVIGCGMQGTAEAFDLAGFGNAKRILMIDRHLECAGRAAERINLLCRCRVAEPFAVDAVDESAVAELLRQNQVNVCCAAAHYMLNLPLTRAAISAGSHFCDMGGNTGIVMAQHELHEAAAASGVTVFPDCGIAPGTANVLAARAIRHIRCDSIRIFCGGLPQNRKLPLGYRIVFSISGLTNEYTGMCMEIRNGEFVELPAFTGKEDLLLPEPLGRCEAFLTSGGSSTGPLSFQGRLRQYSYKTIRYPGHFDAVRAMIDLGLLNLEPVQVNGEHVVPRELFHVLAARYWHFPEEPDLLVMRVIAQGCDECGKPVVMTQDLLDFQDRVTGFTAMERTTAFSAAIIASALAAGSFDPGVQFLERSVDPDWLVLELGRRGIRVDTNVEPVE